LKEFRVIIVRAPLCCLAALLLSFVLAPGSACAAADSDGDGFPDAIENVLGTDPNSAASTPTGQPAVVKPFSAILFISLGFNQADSLAILQDLTGSVPASTDGLQGAFYVGGVARAVTFDADGLGTDSFGETSGAVSTSEGISYLNLVTTGDLAGEFADEGLTQELTSGKQVTVDAVLYFNGVLYSNSTLRGFYATSNVPDVGIVGSASFNQNISDSGATITLSNISANPNPIAAGGSTTVSLGLKAKKIKADSISGSIDYGDGSPEESFSSGQALTHTYAANGVFKISVLLFGEVDGSAISAAGSTFVVVGTGAAVNATNGLVSSATVSDSDGVNGAMANFTIASIEDTTVSDATTTFEEVNDGTTAGASVRDVADGLTPSRVVTKPGLTVATSTAKSSTGQTRGVSRKTVAVGSRQTSPGDSGNVKPPKNNPGVLMITKVSGKFIFKEGSSNKADKVTFAGTITLPEGFAPTDPDGIRFVLGMGNVIDGVLIDAKGKALNKSKGDNGRFQKISIKFPKLANGSATGTEVAKVSVTMSTEDMDLKGFESEGITSALRSDEEGRKAVDRFMQVNMVLGGEPYEAYVPVQFKLSSKADAGGIVSRRAN
jgi:hypothetical protein